MIQVVRLWLDANGVARREVAQLLRVPAGSARGHRFDQDPIEATPSEGLPPEPLMVATVVEPAVDSGSLYLNLNGLYELPLQEGARLVSQEEWDAARATAASAAAGVAQQAKSDATAQQVARRAQLVADVSSEAQAGVSDDRLAQAVAAYFKVNPPPGPTTQQVADAVAAHLQAFPPQPGRAPTEAELRAAAAYYIAANASLFAGPAGLSAYQTARANGFSGTEVQWLATLVGAQGTPGAPADPTVLSNIQGQLALLMSSYNAGVEVRVDQFQVPILTLGLAPFTRTATWTPAFTTGRTVTADAYCDALVGKAGVEVTAATVNDATVRISPTAVTLQIATGFAIGYSRKAA